MWYAGDDHKQLRAWMNPAFSAAAVRQYQPVFARVAQTVSSGIQTLQVRTFFERSPVDYGTARRLRNALDRYVSSAK